MSPYVGPRSLPVVRWAAPTARNFFASAVVSSAGVVFASSRDACVSAWVVATGEAAWRDVRCLSPGDMLASPALSADGSVLYAVTQSGELAALNTADGAIHWTRDLSVGIDGSIAVSPSTGDLFLGDFSGAISSIAASDGSVRWAFQTGSLVASTPALGGGSVFVTSTNGLLYNIEEATGVLIWNTTVSNPSTLSADAITCSPTLSLDGASVFIGTYDGLVVSVSSATGRIQWRRNVSAALNTPVAPSIISTPSLSPWRRSVHRHRFPAQCLWPHNKLFSSS